MKTLTGTYGKDCKVFTDNIEPQALETIQKLLDNPVTEGKPVRIMPDTHDGKGIVIGFTMPVGEWVNPNHIGVDIGCGMLCVEIKNTVTPDMYIDIDQRIREVVPMGFEVHETGANKEYIFAPLHTIGDLFLRGDIDELVQKIGMTRELWENSLGTLGGGNHFIELGRSEKTGKYYLTIHSGSRNFGKRVCDYHAKNLDGYKKMLGEEVERIKQTLPKQQWNDAIKEAKKRLQGREGYLTGEAKEEYLKDMYIAGIRIGQPIYHTPPYIATHGLAEWQDYRNRTQLYFPEGQYHPQRSGIGTPRRRTYHPDEYGRWNFPLSWQGQRGLELLGTARSRPIVLPYRCQGATLHG